MNKSEENFLPFARPDIGEEEIEAVVQALRSGWLSTGPKAQQFEKDFSDFMGINIESLAVNSATSGLHLALEAFGVTTGDEVITTPYTFTATAEVIRYLGADPVFVDINPETFNIDPDRIEEAITPRTKAIIPVHFAGLACDMDPILSIARRHGLFVLEDAAHSLPATYKGRMIGTLDSDATVFSFYATKTITTGEGGMLVARNPNIGRRCKIMRLHGIDRDAFDRYTSSQPSWFYQVVAPGYKYNMPDIAASLGIEQLKKANRFQRRREEIASLYDEHLQDFLELPPHAPTGDVHAWHLYVIRLPHDTTLDKATFIARMTKEGIGTSVHFIPLHLHPYWRDKYDLKEGDFPNADNAYHRAVSLPIYTQMTEENVMRVVKTVRRIL